MEFRHLRYFLVLAEELHFGRAARRLSISQPPLSLNLQQLEASIGTRLLTRNSKRVELTAAGRAFVPAARALLEEAALAASHARDVGQGAAGNLAIGFAGTALYHGLPAVIQRFSAQHPRLKLSLKEMSSSEQLAELQRGRLDVGFLHVTRVPQGLAHILLARQPLVACLPAGHALARKRSLAVAQLEGERFALVSRAVSPDYHERILAICNDAGFDPEVGAELQHWLSVVALVAQGMAVALVPAALRQSGLAGAAFVPLAGEHPSYETHCLWPDAAAGDGGAGSTENAGGAAVAAFTAAVRAAAVVTG